jgi:hypothetical protein
VYNCSHDRTLESLPMCYMLLSSISKATSEIPSFLCKNPCSTVIASFRKIFAHKARTHCCVYVLHAKCKRAQWLCHLKRWCCLQRTVKFTVKTQWLRSYSQDSVFAGSGADGRAVEGDVVDCAYTRYFMFHVLFSCL